MVAEEEAAASSPSSPSNTNPGIHKSGKNRYSGMHGGERDHHQPGCGEAAGEAAANCAAVCCCCPLALLDVVLLLTVKLPAGLLRRVKRRRGRRNGGKPSGAPSMSGSSKAMIPMAAPVELDELVGAHAGAAAAELEEEIMSSRFYGGGFWRSISQRSSASNSSCASFTR